MSKLEVKKRQQIALHKQRDRKYYRNTVKQHKKKHKAQWSREGVTTFCKLELHALVVIGTKNGRKLNKDFISQKRKQLKR